MDIEFVKTLTAAALQGLLSNDWKDYRKIDSECELLAQTAVNYAIATEKALTNHLQNNPETEPELF